MKLLAKGIVTSTLAVGVALGLGVGSVDLPQSEVHAATKPYYKYNGYTSYQSSFILDKHFINAIKYDNLTMNGYKITKTNVPSSNTVELYDQDFIAVNNHKADEVIFSLKSGVVSKSKLVKAYGQPKEKPVKSIIGLVYNYQVGNKLVVFYVNKGYVTDVIIKSTI